MGPYNPHRRQDWGQDLVAWMGEHFPSSSSHEKQGQGAGGRCGKSQMDVEKSQCALLAPSGQHGAGMGIKAVLCLENEHIISHFSPWAISFLFLPYTVGTECFFPQRSGKLKFHKAVQEEESKWRQGCHLPQRLDTGFKFGWINVQAN